MQVQRYSVLTSCKSIFNNAQYVKELIENGIKVILFVDHKTADSYKTLADEFKDSNLLVIVKAKENIPEITIIDGQCDDSTKAKLTQIAKLCKGFNLEQYWVEHAPWDKNIVVTAGAGTGKTKVMIDRILFLLNTVDNIGLDEIGMITFTNKATGEMKGRLEARLISIFKATRKLKYLQWVEEISKIRISTIHKFSLELIKELSSSLNFARSVGIKSLTEDKKRLVKKVLNIKLGNVNSNVSDQLGLELSEMCKAIEEYWRIFDNLSLSNKDIENLDWGNASTNKSKQLNEVFKTTFKELYKEYDKLKHKLDAFSINDVIRELAKIVSVKNPTLTTSLKLRFLFVDEFQDSDNSQIASIAWLQNLLNLNLFVVGDVKQCIYRFRGAVETSFNELELQLNSFGKPKPLSYELIKNYRTGLKLANNLNVYFRKWQQSAYIPDFSDIECIKDDAEPIKIETCKSYSDIKNLVITNIKECLSKKDDEICLLTRTNYELDSLVEWCNSASIPCNISKEGTFYTSKAVLDFFSLIGGFIYQNSNMHLFNMLSSSYFLYDKSLHKLLIDCKNADEISDNIKNILNNSKWYDYKRKFRLEPVLSVLNVIIKDFKPCDIFRLRQEQIYRSKKYDENQLNKQLEIDTTQYKANLNKLFGIIKNNFTSEATNLNVIYNFLKIQIATNKEEDEPIISLSDSNVVKGMTVHKAKGLEFKTVIIPFTNRIFRKTDTTEILINKESSVCKKVAWQYVSKESGILNNDYYSVQGNEETANVVKEEARLLYVALTRAIRKLIVIECSNKAYTWSYLMGDNQ